MGYMTTSIVFDIPDHILGTVESAKKWKFLCQASRRPVIPANRGTVVPTTKSTTGTE